MELGRFVGPIFIIILVVDCLFFAYLEWLIPRDELDYVYDEWDMARFEKVRKVATPRQNRLDPANNAYIFPAQYREQQSNKKHSSSG